MQKKSTSYSAFFSLRTLLIAFICAAVCLIIADTLPAFFRSDGGDNVPQRTLTLLQRVRYQHAIEEVYWRHRIWPKERRDPKPSLDAMISQAQLEKKVDDYLGKSQTLEDYCKQPITAEQLQAEMDRMANNTKKPEVLRELFQALGNNPFVIAECLARPALADRLSLGTAAQLQTKSVSYSQLIPPTAKYILPAVPQAGCTDDSWTAIATTNAPSPRDSHTAIWTGAEMIVWGGTSSAGEFNTGGRYNPATDSWTTITVANAPTARSSHTAIWTGSEMIVWGGTDNSSNYFNTGGRYDPITDTWTATSTTNAPDGRYSHTAVWTGHDMIIWGGSAGFPDLFNTGGKYDPSTDTWTPTSTANAPGARFAHTAIWTGSEMIVWGGNDGNFGVDTGGRYNPDTDTWTPTSTTNAPDGRDSHKAVWTNTEMIVWGGIDFNGFFSNTGGRYNPSADSWTATTLTDVPSERTAHTAVWTGEEMIVWAGFNPFVGGFLNTGGRYNPGTDSWRATSTTDVPDGRSLHSAVWTGTEMIIWAGTGNPGDLNTGARYCAASGATPAPTPMQRVTPTPRPRPTPPHRP